MTYRAHCEGRRRRPSPLPCTRYILRHGRPVVMRHLVTWARWFENDANRRVAATHVGAVRVSTVFLGLDHNFARLFLRHARDPRPILYETMVFGGPHDGDQQRYATRAAALRGHRRLVALARAGMN